MAQRVPVKLDYASAPAALPPPNDAVGLPRTEILNRPARRAVLLAALLPPWLLGSWAAAFPTRGVAIVLIGGVVMLLLALISGIFAVRAMAALDYAGRPAPVILGMGVVLLADLFFALVGVLMLLTSIGIER